MAAASDLNPFQSPPKGDNMFAQITDNVTRIMEAPKPPKAWYIAMGVALSMLTMFLGSITSYLALPLFWLLWTGAMGLRLPLWQQLPGPLMQGFFASMWIGQAVMLATAVIALKDSGRPQAGRGSAAARLMSGPEARGPLKPDSTTGERTPYTARAFS